MSEQSKRKQKPSDPAKAATKPSKRKVAPWMSDDTRVVYSEERGNDDG